MMIEGIPDGWELVRIGKVHELEYYLDDFGRIMQWKTGISSAVNYVVVRKIEKPKQYRPFANPAEAEALLGQVLRGKVNHEHKFVLIGITSHGFQIGLSHWRLQEAFECFERLDGTPFGIEVTE